MTAALTVLTLRSPPDTRMSPGTEGRFRHEPCSPFERTGSDMPHETPEPEASRESPDTLEPDRARHLGGARGIVARHQRARGPAGEEAARGPAGEEAARGQGLRAGEAAVRAARLLHALPGAAESAPGVGPRAHQGVGPRHGDPGRGERRGRQGHLDRARPRLARLCAAVCVHPPRRLRTRARSGDGLVCLGVLLRRPFSRHLQTYQGPEGRQGVPRPAGRLHARPPYRHHGGPDQPGGARPPGSVGSHRAHHVRRLARALLREHQEPARRVAVGARQHPRQPGGQPHRVHRAPPPGRRRALVRQPSSSTRWAARCPPRSPRRGPCAFSGTPSPTGCTSGTTSSPTSERWKKRARTPTASSSWSGSSGWTPRPRPTSPTIS